MLILKIPLNIDSEIDSKSLYKLYSSNLPRIKRQIFKNARKYNDKLMSKDLLKSQNILFKDGLNENELFSDIIVYAVNRLSVYSDKFGHVDYRIRFNSKNPFAKNITLDQLMRVIEFGNDSIKATNILHESINQLIPTIKKLYDLTYNPNILK